MVYQEKCTHMDTIKITDGIKRCLNPVCRRLILTDFSIKKKVETEWES